MIRLVVFDVDGTLAEAYRLRLMPGVREFFQLLASEPCSQTPRLAIATNQGGVGMRYWMEQERFGSPGRYPTEARISERLKRLLKQLAARPDLPVYTSYRFKDKEGRWSPVPEGKESDLRWSVAWRKPSPGMLLQAMQDAGARPDETLFVGDSPDDEGAAQAAGCHFAWAADFFSQDWSSCAALEAILTKQYHGGPGEER